MQQILSTTIDIDLSLELIRINGRYETCDMVARAIVNEIRQIEETKLRIFPSDLTERERWFFRRNLHNLWYEGGIGEYMAEATNTRISLTGGATDGFFEEVCYRQIRSVMANSARLPSYILARRSGASLMFSDT